MDIPHFSFRDAMSCIKSMSLGLHFSRYAHNEKILIRTLAFVNNDWIREKVLDDVSIHYGYTHDKQHRHEILEQAKDINHLMKADHLDFAQARERINRQVVIRP